MEPVPNSAGGKSPDKKHKRKASSPRQLTAGAPKPLTVRAAKQLTAGLTKPLTVGAAKPLAADTAKPLIADAAKPLIAVAAKLLTAGATKPLTADGKVQAPPASVNLQQTVDKPAKIAPVPEKIELIEELISPLVSTQEAMKEEVQVLRELLVRQDKAHEQERKKHSSAYKAMELRVSGLQSGLSGNKDSKNDFEGKHQEKAQGENEMLIVMRDYEKTLNRVVAEMLNSSRAYAYEKRTLVRDKEFAEKHLKNAENSISDLHEKYERAKRIIEGLQKNETELRECMSTAVAKIIQQEEKYDLLKAHATEQLETANRQLETVVISQEADAFKARTMIKKYELAVSSMQDRLEQKQKENEQLTGICDELIARVK